MEDMVRSAHVEQCLPKAKVIRSDAALYVVLLLLAVVGILLTHLLSARFDLLRLPLQVILVLLLVGAGYGIYRNRLTTYRYTLTVDRLLIERIVGARERVLTDVALDDVCKVGPMNDSVRKTEPRAYHGAKAQRWFVQYRDGEAVRTIVISPSEELQMKLSEVFCAD